MEPIDRIVFKRHTDGFNNYRIPAICTTNKGTLLAFAEGRKFPSDQAKNDIVVKRSTDNGNTWGDMITVDNQGKDALNNPMAVVLKESNRILLMYQKYPHPAKANDVIPGWDDPNKKKWIRRWWRPLRVARCYITFSDDDGLSWAPPKDITREIKKPDYATTIASGPGTGIQLRRGPNKGRIIIPFNEGPRQIWTLFCVYSDDLGETWHRGNSVLNEINEGYPNENMMVELNDGSIMTNTRWHGKNRCRASAISKDGGINWSDFKLELDLPDPRCMGSIIRFTDPLDGYKSRIILSNPTSEKGRKNGMIHMSYDEGQTWPVSKNYFEEEITFAYSDLTVLSDNTIGCLCETGSSYNAKEVHFIRFNLEWLTDGKDTLEKGK